MGLAVWNWDGLWEIQPVEKILQKVFPSESALRLMKRKVLSENHGIFLGLHQRVDDAEDALRRADEDRTNAVNELTHKCDYLRTVVAMFRTEADKVKQASAIEDVKINPLECAGRENPERCEFIRRGKVDEICPEPSVLQ